MNSFTTKTDAALVTLANNAALILGSNPGYKVPTATTQAVGAAGASLSEFVDQAKAAQDAAKAATIAKAGKRDAAIAALNAVAAVVYNNGTSDPMIQALGFSPRATGTRPTMPLTVTGVTVSPSAEGTIRVDWQRAGNRASAIFQVERSLDGGATWAIVASTTQVKATLSGYVPGVATWFRVTTTNSVGTSLPSGTAGAYVGETAADAAVELKLAA